MKIKNLKVLVIISTLLVILSLAISVINYAVSLKFTQNDLVNRSLPLSVDNIYTEIQTHIIAPSLLSSMMASDTFVKEWLIHDEENSDRIRRYLEAVKNRYGMFVTFLVSDKSQSYFTQNGLLEKLNKNNPDNQWYYRFKNIPEDHEINLDYNANLDNSLMMFINYKIFDQNYQFIGATGVGYKISYINDLLKRFREQYKFTVYFAKEDGTIVLSEQNRMRPKNISDDQALDVLKDEIFSKAPHILRYTREGSDYLLTTKYIPELQIYLLVEAKIEDFTQDVKTTFYFNLGFSLLVTLIITILILITIRNYNQKVEYLAQHDVLTGLKNRRAFNEDLEKFFLLSRRSGDPLSLLFFDIDNFKTINDTLGHVIGDKILARISELMQQNVRQTDIVARWGGEEFIIALVDTDGTLAYGVAEKIKAVFEHDIGLKELTGSTVTASFGVTQYTSHDTLDNAIIRADKAMYEAKKSGKNKVVIL